MACCLVQFPELPRPHLFCVENAIEGDYVKYNSNSGFVNVADVQLRNTPQAFSHFSFEHSGGASLVVDIQVPPSPRVLHPVRMDPERTSRMRSTGNVKRVGVLVPYLRQVHPPCWRHTASCVLREV